MKLLRFGERGAERPGILDPEGIARDLGGVIDDISGETLLDEGMEVLRLCNWRNLPRVLSPVDIGISGR